MCIQEKEIRNVHHRIMFCCRYITVNSSHTSILMIISILSVLSATISSMLIKCLYWISTIDNVDSLRRIHKIISLEVSNVCLFLMRNALCVLLFYKLFCYSRPKSKTSPSSTRLSTSKTKSRSVRLVKYLGTLVITTLQSS